MRVEVSWSNEIIVINDLYAQLDKNSVEQEEITNVLKVGDEGDENMGIGN